MPSYESLAWPLGMMKRFTHVPSILQNIQGWGISPSRIMIMAGTEDKLMGVKLMKDMAEEYREGVKTLSGKKRIEPAEIRQTRSEISQNVGQTVDSGVSMTTIRVARHHVQNDVQSEEAAEALKMFLEQL
jgi:hypothetical protein